MCSRCQQSRLFAAHHHPLAIEADFAHKLPQVAFREACTAIEHAGTQGRAERIELTRRQHGHRQLLHALGARHLDEHRLAPCLELLRPDLEHVIHRQQALLHRLIKPVRAGFQFDQLLLERTQRLVLPRVSLLELLLHLAQHVAQALRCQHLVGERSQDEVVHLGHGHGRRAAGASASPNAGIALVVLVAPALARGRGHASAAAIAAQQACQQRWRVHHPRRRDGR
nr:hypothetical protein [Rhodoferax sediminis]